MESAMPRRMLAFARVPIGHLALTALASCAAIALAVFIGWPIWAVAVAAIVPWLTIFQREAAWIYRHYRWLALPSSPSPAHYPLSLTPRSAPPAPSSRTVSRHWTVKKRGHCRSRWSPTP